MCILNKLWLFQKNNDCQELISVYLDKVTKSGWFRDIKWQAQQKILPVSRYPFKKGGEMTRSEMD